MDFYFPTEFPEQLAFCGAAATALIGLLMFVMPASALKIGGFSIGDVTADGYAAVRSSGGIQLGLALTALFLAQDWTYLALGAAMLFGSAGRLIAMVANRGATIRNGVIMLLQVAIALLPLGYVFGYF
ncbi:DUF4345 domain-containing protein [Rhizobium sp. SSA_523]|uniref:AGROH133_08824 family phage infection protein n=1 Tax=Rhizobium sp. SSA_523 TaxID=2952477 RepID=UPI0020902C1E|nr:DUF4345 domain-containing protein [Rhizobium sp. SSA_523]MCO5733601.1 DUF4345 domain-containing protein [Rhizobium sp. SSA_523]WKC23102.1 DUF4345 domain-containing protein [Rhizobium sp. SSA_523]